MWLKMALNVKKRTKMWYYCKREQGQEGKVMIQRSNIIIDPDKSDSFARFIQKNAKDSAFWERNRQEARRSIDKSKLDSLYK